LFERKLKEQPPEVRQAKAHTASEPDLSAYCFDPHPAVVGAVLENSQAGLRHARLIARHHRTTTGLELLVRNAARAADEGVKRGLLQNPLLSQPLYQRIWGNARPLQSYRLTVSREVPERTRKFARDAMRTRFSTCGAEERVELILKTEGRCLAQLAGLPIDSKTTSLLCMHHVTSTMLVQNIARWSAAPPILLAHLMRQEAVRRNPTLRIALERHPNSPRRSK
jgi:hypothetical protein